jgi:hypothetical protein
MKASEIFKKLSAAGQKRKAGLIRASQQAAIMGSQSTGRTKRGLTHFSAFFPDGRWFLYSQDEQNGTDLLLVENFR